MSRSISESLSLLSETLGNCKTNLKDKEVADVDNIKISDVDEKIAEIQAGGSGGGFNWIENVTDLRYSSPINTSFFQISTTTGENTPYFPGIKFTPKEDVLVYISFTEKLTITPQLTNEKWYGGTAKKGIEYTIELFQEKRERGFIVFGKPTGSYFDRLFPNEKVDIFAYDVND